jgi:hypothetical protein
LMVHIHLMNKFYSLEEFEHLSSFLGRKRSLEIL